MSIYVSLFFFQKLFTCWSSSVSERAKRNKTLLKLWNWRKLIPLPYRGLWNREKIFGRRSRVHLHCQTIKVIQHFASPQRQELRRLLHVKVKKGKQTRKKQKTRNLTYDAIINDVTHQFGFSAFQYRFISELLVELVVVVWNTYKRLY